MTRFFHKRDTLDFASAPFVYVGSVVGIILGLVMIVSLPIIVGYYMAPQPAATDVIRFTPTPTPPALEKQAAAAYIKQGSDILAMAIRQYGHDPSEHNLARLAQITMLYIEIVEPTCVSYALELQDPDMIILCEMGVVTIKTAGDIVASAVGAGPESGE